MIIKRGRPNKYNFSEIDEDGVFFRARGRRKRNNTLNAARMWWGRRGKKVRGESHHNGISIYLVVE